jgi:hypothetical protein
MYVQSAKVFFGVWTPDDCAPLRQVVDWRHLRWRRVIRLKRDRNLPEVQPVPSRPQAGGLS